MTFRLIPTDQKFYELFAAQAAVAAEGARVLEAELRDYVDPVAAADQLRELEHRGDDVNHAVLAHLEATFVVPFERQDIHALTGVLDDIIDLVEKVGDLLVLYHVPVAAAGRRRPGVDPGPGVRRRSSRACAALVRPIDLRAYPPRIHALEKEGDALRRRLIEQLFDAAAERARGPDRRGDLRRPRGRDRRRRPGRPRPGPDRHDVRAPTCVVARRPHATGPAR